MGLDNSALAPPRTEEVADGVFAYVQPDGGWCVNNCGIVTDGGETALIDTVATEERAVRLRKAVADVAGGGPGVVVNTHHHSDHTFGNHLFAPDALFVAHERTRTEMTAAGLGLTQLWPDVGWGDVRVTLPSLTFRDRATLNRGGIGIELIHFGTAHTTNDVVVWIPDRGVLFTGDIAMSGVTPYCLMGSIQGSLDVLAQMRALGATTVVPGHGPVGGPEILDANTAYLSWIQEVARAGAAAGMSPLEAARAAEPGSFAELLDPERLVGNLHRAYVELAGSEGPELGTPLDVVASFMEMVEFHGRLPDCHA
ncbi:MBL fold metallo-hydrolase [Streptodolium elevatio]|uniref:MBL fold metallo-hydrolase n=1 Tax=Streptodolium elevatio TaxID=3157996 RepID=A0ABV3DPQ0_9ACTN